MTDTTPHPSAPPPSRALGQMLVGNILSTAAVRHARREALFCSSSGRRLSFAGLHARTNQLAHALLGQGLRKGERVAFLGSNRAEMAETYFALARTGLVGLPLNWRLAPVEMVELMREVGATTLIYERRFAQAARHVQQHMPEAGLHIGYGEGEAVDRALDYETLLAPQPTHEPQVPLCEDDPFYFNLTSGTTGLPKCYCLSHYAVASGGGMFLALDVTAADTLLSVFPMYGRVGFAWLTCGLMYGNRNVLANFDPPQVLALMERERITTTNLVATMAAMLLECPALEHTDLSSLRSLVFAGSMLPAPLRHSVQQRLCAQLYEYYGMQESGALVVSTPQDRLKRPDSVGRPILFAEVRVLDEEGQDAAPGQSGEIVGRSPNAVTSYFNNPQKSRETFRNGWLHTGDLGHLDEEGYLFINGRIKDMIISGGQNIHAAEVEACILAFDAVLDCAVIGLPDKLWGEAVSAVVVPRDGQTIDTQALLHHCRQTLAGFKVPKQVLVQHEALPHTPTGKIQKFLLVEKYGKEKYGKEK